MVISNDALEPMVFYNWNGNIRELKNFIERLVIMSDGDKITYHQVINIFPESFTKTYSESNLQNGAIKEQFSLKEHLDRFEKQLLQKEYFKAEKNVSRMAINLKTDRPNLHRKLIKFRIKE